MDQALSSSRYRGQQDRGDGSSRQHHQHHHHRNDRQRRRHHPYGGGGRGRGGGHYRDNRRGPPRGGPRQSRSPGNRFGGAQTTSVDPQTAMLRQLGALLGKIGELETPPDGSTIVESIRKNISDLAMVLCSKDNAPQFLKFGAITESVAARQGDMQVESTETSTRKAEEESGALAHLVISTVSTLPLQTPSYAGLTLAVNELSPKPEFSGFANRCVVYGMRHFSRALDSLLLDGISEEDRSRTMSRLVHLLRYFALLGRLSVVMAYEDDDLMGTPRTEGLSVAGLLHMLTAASIKSATSMNQMPSACLLAQLVLSTLPYVQNTIPKEFVVEQLLEPLETNVLNSETYKSTFAPGIGSTALLLKEEQDEGIDDDDEEEDDEDDDEEDESGKRCDTLQDLLRSVKRLEQSNEKSTEFTMLTDAPWVGLKAPSTEQPVEGEEALPEVPLTYTGDPIRLSFSSDCKSIPSILSEGDAGSIQVQCFELSGVVFGRLPIFGSPPEDDDDEEDEEEMDVPKSENLQTYQKGFGLLDRYFLADAVRDCLLNHQSSVSDAGLERGTAKDVAQQLWSINFLYPQKGVEYGIIEAMLSLIMQDNNEGAYRNLFVSRVLLELTRLQPSIMPQALALAVSNIVSYYLPALVPAARENFSRWFSFHLNNTDYQWPSGYWEHWSEYVTNGKRNSRGDFVLRTLSLMASQLNEVESLVTDCLPSGSVLPKYLLAHEPDEKEPTKPHDAILAIERDVEVRIWEKNEDPDSLREYMVGDELSETIRGANFDSDDGPDLVKRWWRTGIAIRALLQPATKQHASEREAIERAIQPSEDSAMEQGDSNPDDVLVMLTENLVRYRPFLLGALARDAESNDTAADLQGEAKTTESEQLLIGESFLLKQLESGLLYSHVLLENCVSCVVENDIASSMAVLYWALGSVGDTKNAIVKRWWDFAGIAIRISVEKALDSVDTRDEEPLPGGMVIDRGEADDANQNGESVSARKMDAIIQHISPIMQCMTKRVCTLLDELEDGKNKLTPEMVDLVEGLKTCVVATKTLTIYKLITGDDSATQKEAHELWSKSSITGPDIASICSDQETTCYAIQTLITSLQAM